MLSLIRRSLCKVASQPSHVSAVCLSGKSRCFSASSSASSESDSASSFVAIRLNPTKRLMRVSGIDSFIYLQSLLTNDMRQLLPVERLKRNWGPSNYSMTQIGALDQPVIYAYLLSAVGKVLADLYVYRGRYRAEDGEYILEVDGKLATALKRLLLGYNLSRNIKVEFANDLALWTVIPLSAFTSQQPDYTFLEEIESDDLKLIPDPRLGTEYLGYKFLSRLGGDKLEDVGKYLKRATHDDGGNRGSKKIRLYEGSISDYIQLRYRLGVAEGVTDILSGFYFPFELNGDLMNAVSLNKGLYTSEEKVIKIYSADAIKRRIFPVEFLGQMGGHQPAPRTFISAEPRGSSKFGELRGRIGRHGIATLWVPFANNKLIHRSVTGSPFPILTHTDTGLKMRASIPAWWPARYDVQQLPIPDYPRCLFDLSPNKNADVEIPKFYGIPKDQFTTSLQVIPETS